MKTGKIISIDSYGAIEVQFGDSVVGAKVMTGSAHIGSLVNGPMEAGIRMWLCSHSRVMVVNVHPNPVRTVDRCAAAA